MTAHTQQNELKHTRQKLVSLGVAAPLQRLRMTAHTQQNELLEGLLPVMVVMELILYSKINIC